MKKSGITFKPQKAKMKTYCLCCGKEIKRGNKEYVSVDEDVNVMHYCPECIVKNENIPAKEGASIKYNDRKYSWIIEIKGKHFCDLTGQIIKEGSDCWWSSKSDDPNKKKPSYFISIESLFEIPNEFEENEIIETSENNENIEQEEFTLTSDSEIKEEEVKNENNDVMPWYDEHFENIFEKHMREDVNSLLEQIYGKDFSNMEVIYKYDKPSISLKEYVNKLIFENKNKTYFAFWKEKNGIINIINGDRIKKVITCIGKENSEKPIDEIVLLIPEIYCDMYEKNENNNWIRIN